MTTIKFIQQLPNKTIPKDQLQKTYKIKKGKKLFGVILSIIRDFAIIARIIDLDLLDTNHYKTIYYLVYLSCIFLSIFSKWIK